MFVRRLVFLFLLLVLLSGAVLVGAQESTEPVATPLATKEVTPEATPEVTLIPDLPVDEGEQAGFWRGIADTLLSREQQQSAMTQLLAIGGILLQGGFLVLIGFVVKYINNSVSNPLVRDLLLGQVERLGESAVKTGVLYGTELTRRAAETATATDDSAVIDYTTRLQALEQQLQSLLSTKTSEGLG